MKPAYLIHTVHCRGTNGALVEYVPGTVEEFGDEVYADLIARGAVRDPSETELQLAQMAGRVSKPQPAKADKPAKAEKPAKPAKEAEVVSDPDPEVVEGEKPADLDLFRGQ